MTEGSTLALAERIVATRIADAPPEAVRVARDLFFDTVGVTLAGAAEPGAAIVRKFVAASGPAAGPARVLGTAMTTSPVLAALANGTAAAILDYDDSTWRMIGHPSGTVVPAVLALGEARRMSGRAALEAYMIGHETIDKIARATVPPLYMRGRHTTGALGVFGAAAAAARLLGLDATRTAVALGIAASLSGAVRASHGTMTKGLHSGEAAANGIKAALLAEEGFTARSDALEHVHGFIRSALAEGEYDLARLGRGFAAPWGFLDPDGGPGVKLIPSGTTSFCAGECAMEIHRRHRPDPARIAAVEWRTTPLSLDIARYQVPEDRNQAFYSVPWVIAVALIDGRAGLAQFDEGRIRDPLARALAAKVRMTLHPDLKETGDPSQSVAGELIVRMEGGTEHRHTRLRPRAYPRGEPWTRETLREKYREGAARALPGEAVEASIRLVEGIEAVADLAELGAALRGARL
ncbi:MAG: MmgE/PrpD family protein [Proteobacteria bacterium]|nr:MmgE/PrpD family protein [Pseudomonadota bacterium]